MEVELQPFLNLFAECWWVGVVIAMPRPHFRREGAPLPFWTGGWVGVRNISEL